MTPDLSTGRGRTAGTVVVVGVLLALILGGAYWFIQGARDPLETTTAPAAGPEGSQTHSTAGGHYRWTLPADWTVTREWAGPDTTDLHGLENERWVFRDPDRTAVLSADTGVVPVDDVGFKPDVVEVVDTERLGVIPGAGAEGRETWYRTAILQENGLTGDEGFFDGEDYRLTVQVVTVPPGADPESTGEDFHSAWTYVLPPAKGMRQSTSAFLEGHITLPDAEAITGERGVDALRAVLDAEEYRELKDVATSLEVTAP